jgi:uncharacterized protein
MRMTETEFTGALPIDGYGAGFFRIGGDVHEGDQLLLPGGPTAVQGYEDPSGVIGAKDTFDVLLIGTGSDIAQLPDPMKAALTQAGIFFEIMPTPSACRTYNVLASEGRRVAAYLIAI